VLPDPVMPRSSRRRRRVRREGVGRGCPQRFPARAEQGNPPGATAEGPTPDPGNLPQRAELVEQARLIPRDTSRQNVPLEHRGRDGRSGELVDQLGEALERGLTPEPRVPGCTRRDGRQNSVPFGEEAGQGGRLDRLDFLPKLRERPPPKLPQDIGIAPLALHAARSELTPQDAAPAQ